MHENRYESPDTQVERVTFKDPLDKWSSIGLILCGVATLGYGIYRALFEHRMSTIFLGGGAGLLVWGWLKYNLSPRLSNRKYSDTPPKPKGREEVYAVVRHDTFASTDQFTVKEIVRSLEIAKAEVERLNTLNENKGCVYSWQTTRLYPKGTAAGPLESY